MSGRKGRHEQQVTVYLRIAAATAKQRNRRLLSHQNNSTCKPIPAKWAYGTQVTDSSTQVTDPRASRRLQQLPARARMIASLLRSARALARQPRLTPTALGRSSAPLGLTGCWGGDMEQDAPAAAPPSVSWCGASLEKQALAPR